MAKKHFQFTVPGKHKPSVELSADGLYVRFQTGVQAAETILRSEWPHVAVDLAANGSVIGIECVPTPERFTLGSIAKKAGVALPSRISAADLQFSACGKRAAPMAVAS